MKRFLFALMLFSFCKISLAQSIVAGQHQQWDRYYDFVPDTSFFYCVNCDSIDLNGDGIDDITFGIYSSYVTQWGYDDASWILPLANSQLVFLKTDTCYRYDSINLVAYVNGFAKTFNYNSVIDGSNIWVDTSLYIQKAKQEVVNFYSCHYETVHDTFTYIGVRIFNPDTLYGWIKLKIVAGCPGCHDTLKVESFACQTSLTGISTFEKNESVNIFPNPSAGIFKCSNYFSEGKLEVKDVTGRIIYSREIKNEEPIIDLTNCSEGIYFLSVVSNEKKFVQRIILCK